VFLFLRNDTLSEAARVKWLTKEIGKKINCTLTRISEISKMPLKHIEEAIAGLIPPLRTNANPAVAAAKANCAALSHPRAANNRTAGIPRD
jgi:hypothetical protein